MTRALTARQKIFAHEYIKDHVATAAARRAGYSPGTAGSEGSKLIKLPHVEAYILHLIKKQAERLDIDADKVAKRLMQIAYADIREAFDENGNLLLPHQWNDETAASIAGMDLVMKSLGEGEVEYTKKIKRVDQVKALEILAKRFKLFDDSPKLTVHLELGERLNRAKERVG